MTNPTTPPTSAPIEPARLVAAHHAARAFYRQQLLAADGPRRYLHGRGLGVLAREPGRAGGVDQPWHVGYAPPGWTALVEHLTSAEFTPAELVAAGLAIPARRGGLVDVFRDRIMFPIHNRAGDPVAFLGRAAPGAGHDIAKYFNSIDTAICHKRETLYGLGEQADRVHANAAPVVVEGATDVLAIWLTSPDPSGYLTVAACGTSLTDHHAATLAAQPGARHGGITTVFDADPAGRKATLRAWQLLSVHKGVELNAVVLPPGADPADLARASTNELRAALTRTQPLAQAVIDITLDDLLTRRPDALTFVESRIHALHGLAAMLVDLPPHQIALLARHIADRTDSGIDLVADIIIEHLEHDPIPRPDHASPTRSRSAPARDGPTPHSQPLPLPAPTTDRAKRSFPTPTLPTQARPATASPEPAAAHPRRSR